MRMRLIAFLAVMLIFGNSAFPEEAKTMDLVFLIDEALENNPGVQAAYNKWKAAVYKVREVTGLPDPMARYSYFGESVETRVGPQESKFGVSQKFPFPGKLSLKGKAQFKNARMLEEKYEAAKREVIKNVKFLYYDIYWIDRATQITEEEKVIIESLEKVAQRKYEANFAPQQDVVKAQVELSNLIAKLFVLKQQRDALEARMNEALNRPQGMPVGKAGNVQPEDFEYALDRLHAIAKESRQELLAANLDIERAEYEKSLARMEYLPDITLGFDYIEVGDGHTTSVDDGQDAWMGTIAINVPIWFDKLFARNKEKEKTLEASKKNYQNISNAVAYEVEDLYSKILTYRDIVSLYRTALIPQTEQAFEAAKTGYETGRVDFLNWLDAERVLLQTRLAYYKAIVDYQKSVAYLERVVGRDL